MDLTLDQKSENAVRNLEDINYALMRVDSDHSNNQEVSREKEYSCLWEESVELNSSDQAKFITYTKHSPIQGSATHDDENITLESSLPDTAIKCTTEHPRGRASIVRLHVVQSSESSQTSKCTPESAEASSYIASKCTSESEEASSFIQGIHFTETSSSNTDGSKLTNDSENWSWPDICSVECGEIQNPNALCSPSAAASGEPEMTSSSSNADDTLNSQEMQRFVTADGQYVYGYKDSSGEFQFFYPTMNDRENHNEKERRRRSRVSEACSRLRKVVPGLSDKTDKASVFEQTANYLKFLREKYGTQFDKAFFDKYLKGSLTPMCDNILSQKMDFNVKEK